MNKTLIRKQICFALNQDNIEVARSLMSKLCKKSSGNRNWTNEEKEFLIHHVNALGFEEGCKKVASKLDRAITSVKKQYRLVTKEKDLPHCRAKRS